MTLAQIVETVLIRAYEGQNEGVKRLFRWEIEAMMQGGLTRLYKRLQESGKASKLLKTTNKTTDADGVITLDANFVISSLEHGGDGYLWFQDASLNEYLPISYEPIYENRYLHRPMPNLYYYSIFPGTTSSKVLIYKGDGNATTPGSGYTIVVTGLFIPTNTDVSNLDVESTEMLIQILIELVRERSMSDAIPTVAPANMPTRITSTPSPQ